MDSQVDNDNSNLKSYYTSASIPLPENKEELTNSSPIKEHGGFSPFM
jgi:hypothetical protein